MGHWVDPVRAEMSADATWPAQETEPLGPWRLRATRGYSRRGNSVRTAGEISMAPDWLSLIEQAEGFYRERGLPPMFHLSPATVPPDLETILAGRGYQAVMPSEVWSGDPAKVLQLTQLPRAGGQIAMSDDPDDGWMRCALDEPIGRIEIRQQICCRIPRPRVFAAITQGDDTVARGLSAVHSGVGWMYCMATISSQQRRGFARRLVHDLAQWVTHNGAQAFYLQVAAENWAAKGLYSRAGFEKRYDYHYRVRK